MAGEAYKSGEVNNIILGLLKENRDDLKLVLSQVAVMNATMNTHVQRLATGDERMNGFDTRLVRVEVKMKTRQDEPTTDYPPHPIAPAPRSGKQAEATTQKVRRGLVQDPSLWVKVGLLVGGVVGGYLAATGGKGTP